MKTVWTAVLKDLVNLAANAESCCLPAQLHDAEPNFHEIIGENWRPEAAALVICV